jgi:hypothetical protein
MTRRSRPAFPVMRLSRIATMSSAIIRLRPEDWSGDQGLGGGTVTFPGSYRFGPEPRHLLVGGGGAHQRPQDGVARRLRGGAHPGGLPRQPPGPAAGPHGGGPGVSVAGARGGAAPGGQHRGRGRRLHRPPT